MAGQQFVWVDRVSALAFFFRHLRFHSVNARWLSEDGNIPTRERGQVLNKRSR